MAILAIFRIGAGQAVCALLYSDGFFDVVAQGQTGDPPGFPPLTGKVKWKRCGLRRLHDLFDALQPFRLGYTIGNKWFGMGGMHSGNTYYLHRIIQDADYPDVGLGAVQGGYEVDRSRQGKIDH